MITLSKMHPSDWKVVKEIYEDGIATGNATFQQTAPEWDEWDKSHLPHSRLVAKEDGNILGWAALTGVSDRCVYSGVAEVSVYIGKKVRGMELGMRLLQTLINESESNNIWTLQAGIFPENIPSIKLHESCGFKILGRRERIGKMNGKWRDTILLERRSNTIGII